LSLPEINIAVGKTGNALNQRKCKLSLLALQLKMNFNGYPTFSTTLTQT